jgi:adenosylhomocysteine nucleosidase
MILRSRSLYSHRSFRACRVCRAPRRSTIVLLFIAVIGLGSFTQADNVAFFYALDTDLQALKLSTREIGQPLAVGSRRIHRLSLGPHTIYSVKMGSGSVETAASAQALLSRFYCDWAFSLGPAGALSDDLETGRWYRVNRVVAWQRGTTRVTGMSLSEFSTWETDWIPFPADVPSPLFQSNAAVSVASGEMFVASTSERERIRATTEADAVDMNSFGLALVCADHGVPLFAWKIISDRADENAPGDFRTFVAGYKGEGGKALAEIIAALPANPRDPASYPAIEKLLRGE